MRRATHDAPRLDGVIEGARERGVCARGSGAGDAGPQERGVRSWGADTGAERPCVFLFARLRQGQRRSSADNGNHVA